MSESSPTGGGKHVGVLELKGSPDPNRCRAVNKQVSDILYGGITLRTSTIISNYFLEKVVLGVDTILNDQPAKNLEFDQNLQGQNELGEGVHIFLGCDDRVGMFEGESRAM